MCVLSCSCRAINRARVVLVPCLIVLVPYRASCLIVLVPYRASCLKPLSKPGPSTYRAVLKPVNYRVVPCRVTKNRAVLRAGPLDPARFDIFTSSKSFV